MNQTLTLDFSDDKARDLLQSKVISFLRLPLIIFVIIAHCGPQFQTEPGLLYNTIFFIFNNIFAGIRVPTFFLFSGFLFFYNCEFTEKLYIKKLKNRTRTILLPYILWNLFVFLFLYADECLIGNTSNGIMTNLNGIDYVRLFWDFREGFYPICGQFWFLRDLMVMFILSPVFYFTFKKASYYPLIVVAFCYIFDMRINVTGLSLTAVLFFGLGAYLAINKKRFTDLALDSFKFSITLYPLLAIWTILIALNIVEEVPYVNIRSLSIVIGVFAVIGLTTIFISRNRWHVNSNLSNSTFFLYAYHQVFLAAVTNILVNKIAPTNDWACLTVYFTSVSIIILAGVLIYLLLRRYAPTFTKIITGGR